MAVARLIAILLLPTGITSTDPASLAPPDIWTKRHLQFNWFEEEYPQEDDQSQQQRDEESIEDPKSGNLFLGNRCLGVRAGLKH